MITHLKARIAASLFTIGAVLHPAAGHCKTIATAPTVTQMDHISVSVSGNGSPIVLIPGLSSPRAVWDGVVPDLAKTHRVYVVQINGFAGDAPGKNLGPGLIDGVVADLDRLLVKTKATDAKLVGHSLGGLVTLKFAKAHPDHLQGAMIVDSLPYVGEIFVPGATVAMLEPRAKAMRDAMVASYGQPANAAVAEGTANGLALKPESQAKVKAWFLATDPRVSGEALYEDLTTDLRGDMADIKTPLTIVYPWNARLPKDRADAAYRGAYAKAPNVRYVDIGDAAHFVMLDQPAAFAAALKDFAEAR
ncbi:alpha/beta hydrolase [Sphingomonas sp. Leaf357]|uniref:alpha/beta fold hydrolase n=1 Tax=Sphingomonas sp. Leaf357 TaxID=1736350 RepID=UPI0006FD2934|nr:alpha/beta hydrolase [Sphingomonas sp. Leaf357]KQS03512.1 alpha/beta hydrolase [Sphingomonas sp. Leaf357]